MSGPQHRIMRGMVTLCWPLRCEGEAGLTRSVLCSLLSWRVGFTEPERVLHRLEARIPASLSFPVLPVPTGQAAGSTLVPSLSR